MTSMPDKINISEKFELFSDYWTPKIIGQLNGQDVRLAKLKGEFVWHQHAQEDEMFLVVKGKLNIELRDKTLYLNAGEMIIIPAGVEHRPIAEEEVHVMLFEPSAIKHTGEVKHSLTKEKFDHI